MIRSVAVMILLVGTVFVAVEAQAPAVEDLQLQLRAMSERLNAKDFDLNVCLGEVAQSRYQKAQQSDSDALKALMADVQAKHPTETVTIGPTGWVYTPKDSAHDPQ